MEGRQKARADATSDPKSQELVYAARISLDRTQMQVDENMVNLSPGMAVTVEIKTGSRSMHQLPTFAAVPVQAREPEGEVIHTYPQLN